MDNTVYQLILRDRAEALEDASRRTSIGDEERCRLQAQARAARNIDAALMLADLPKDAIPALLQLAETAQIVAHSRARRAWARVELACYTEALDVLSHPDAPTTMPPSPPSPLIRATE